MTDLHIDDVVIEVRSGRMSIDDIAPFDLGQLVTPVAGVTFANDPKYGGRSRQNILLDIKRLPSDWRGDALLRPTTFNGQYAVQVFVGTQMVGWIPSKHLATYRKIHSRIVSGSISIVGRRTKGMRLTLLYLQKPEQTLISGQQQKKRFDIVVPLMALLILSIIFGIFKLFQWILA